VTDFMNQVLAYLPNVIVAILIFLFAAIVAGAISAAVTRTIGDPPTGKIIATVTPALVMVIALFMILQQLQIAAPIVQIAFAATMGGLALALALAFGLGGRVVAQRMLEQAYRQGKAASAAARQEAGSDRDVSAAQSSATSTWYDDSRAAGHGNFAATPASRANGEPGPGAF
jgi:Conserved TM helix